ncbi:MAG: cytochrome c-type biogenesis protein CcmH [Chloroflexi bacterium]|nr:cytochrome c-type biogenesis protein CcmH [Chloroflexota bacterium]
MRYLKILVVLRLLLAFTTMPAFAEGPVDEIGTNLMCQCGCTMVLSSCDCGTAEQMRGEIRDLLGQGKSQQQILDYYVGKYGEKVLAAPVAQGFNISAYVTPFAAILLGEGLIALIVRQWVIRTRTTAPQPVPVPIAASSPDELRARLARELQAYE